VRVDDEPAETGVAKNVLNSGIESAFGQPKAGGIRAKRSPIGIAADPDLGAGRFRESLEQRKEGVGSRRGSDLQAAAIA
jgi:hypothetical protein